jgi:hypothetical protein
MIIVNHAGINHDITPWEKEIRNQRYQILKKKFDEKFPKKVVKELISKNHCFVINGDKEELEVSIAKIIR